MKRHPSLIEKAVLVSVSSHFLLCQMQATIPQDQKSNRATGQDEIVLDKTSDFQLMPNLSRAVIVISMEVKAYL